MLMRAHLTASLRSYIFYHQSKSVLLGRRVSSSACVCLFIWILPSDEWVLRDTRREHDRPGGSADASPVWPMRSHFGRTLMLEPAHTD
jgi:hypothetical protein